MEFCSVCSQTSLELISVEENDPNGIKWQEKLRVCVPEVNWLDSFLICTPCTSLLQSVYAFKELCLRTDANRREQTLKIDEIEIEPKYKCNICHKVFITNTTLRTHINKHQDGWKFLCKLCNKKFPLETHLTLHIQQTHNENPICFHCNDIFKGKRTLIAHLQTAHALPINTHAPSNVKRDRRRKPTPTPSSCEICSVTFNTPYLLKRHLQNVHATEKKYACDMCDQKFVSRVYLNAHKRYHSGKRPHICSFCGKGFITGSDLYHHEKIHKNARAYKCETCPKAFNTSSDLHKHRLCVHEDRSAWKHVCAYCARRFPQKNNLDAHVKTHTGERNFPCHLCERRCVNKSVLMRHIRSHSNVRLFKCTICNMEYKYQKSLDIHLTKAHNVGNARIPERVKKYFCHICPKAYFANNKLQKHIRAHTGERPFACHVCEKRFIDKSYVRQHLKTSHSIIWPASNPYDV